MFTAQPADGAGIMTGKRLPILFYAMLLFFFGIGTMLVASSLAAWRRWQRQKTSVCVPVEKLQFAIWLVCLLGALVLALTAHSAPAIICLLVGQFLPRTNHVDSSDARKRLDCKFAGGKESKEIGPVRLVGHVR